MKAISFDFSIAKPACCFYDNGKYTFYVWPLNITDKEESLLKEAGVVVDNRKLGHINAKDYSITNLERINLERAEYLADIIFETISPLIDTDTMIGTEGLSFASKGNQYLNLVEYRSIMLDTFYRNNYVNIFTYSPISIKSVAGCSKKQGMGKKSMIEAFKAENIDNEFHKKLCEEPCPLIKKVLYVDCVDDIVDSYWCMKTLFYKEKLN